ncbi:MAG: hypothetical protein LBL58_04260 [Tannerellaceae bacterium]|jgi:hypothetical protein|nr:hypothetical protein [Tannerellaceae bacterium]
MKKEFMTIIALIFCLFACGDDKDSQKPDEIKEEAFFKTEKTFKLTSHCGTLEYQKRLGKDFENGFNALKETFTFEKDMPVQFDTLFVDFKHDERIFIGIAHRDERGVSLVSTGKIIDSKGNLFIWFHCDD